MKSFTFLILQLLTLVGVVALEITKNVYIANVLVIFKVWAGVQAATIFLLLISFSSKLPSQSVVNNALSFTRDEKKSGLQRLNGWTMRTLLYVSIAVTLAVGQWFLFLCFSGVTIGLWNVKKAAANYLKHVKIDFDKKTAVIDV